MNEKKSYKEIRKKLKNRFDKPRGNEYNSMGSVGMWLKQCGIEPTPIKLNIICKIKGNVPYPYQEADRLFIIEYLQKNKYKHFIK